jgi:S-adenosylmethionine-diacylglycerol 3-amino-3-carboxypropyl transferase
MDRDDLRLESHDRANRPPSEVDVTQEPAVTPSSGSESIEERASFDLIRYANCWEDADVLCEALGPSEGRRFLSVASGGDNSLALVAEGAEVVAADLSPAQLHLVELKTAAIRHLDHEQALAFLGVLGGTDRSAVYRRLRADLTPEARAFWDARADVIAQGVIHHGKFEGYFRLFRKRVLPLVHRRRTVLQLLRERDEAGRVKFYEERWNNLRWRLLFRVFFGRFVMGRLGRDPEFFRFVEGSVAERILGRTRYALTVLPTHRNPYLEYILTGNFSSQRPRFLRPTPFAALKQRLDRLVLFRGTVQDAAREHGAGGFDGFNLSDIFEYLDPPTCREVYGPLLDVARPTARLAYWNMLVPRSCPGEFEHRVRSLTEEANRLFRRDLAFFYSAFILEEAV